jgi:hypothetical protein
MTTSNTNALYLTCDVYSGLARCSVNDESVMKRFTRFPTKLSNLKCPIHNEGAIILSGKLVN